VGFCGAATFVIQFFASGRFEIFNVSAVKAFFISIGITLFLSVTNFISKYVATYLTRIEKHPTWSGYRKNEGIKLLSFKIFNVIAFYVAGFFAFAPNRCYFEYTGLKFFTLILSDLIIMNLLEVSLPGIKTLFRNIYRSILNKGGDDVEKEDFDVAQEYLEILYRQFVIYIGMIVFPLMAVLGLLTNVIEFPLDKYRMLRQCNKPQRLDHSMKTFLLIWMMILPVLALLCFPQGPVWDMFFTRGTYPGYDCCAVLDSPKDYVFPTNLTCVTYSNYHF